MATPIIEFYGKRGKDGRWGDCPFSQRVKMTLIYKGLPFEEILIDLSSKPEFFLRLSPNGTVPVLRYDALVLKDSELICRFLEKEHPDPSMLPQGDQGEEEEGEEGEEEEEGGGGEGRRPPTEVLDEFGERFFPAFKEAMRAEGPGREEEALSRLREELWKLEGILAERERRARGGRGDRARGSQPEGEGERGGEGEEGGEVRAGFEGFLLGRRLSIYDAKVAPQLHVAETALRVLRGILLLGDQELRRVREYLQGMRGFRYFEETMADEDVIADGWGGIGPGRGGKEREERQGLEREE